MTDSRDVPSAMPPARPATAPAAAVPTASVPLASELAASTGPALPADDLDGHTMEQLSDYLAASRVPADPSIDESPGCQIALAALERLRVLSRSVIEADVVAGVTRGDDWVAGVLANIDLEARAGRDLPLRHSDPRAHLMLSEGAVRSLIRSVGDGIGAFLIGRIELDGDVTLPGAPTTVHIAVSVLHGVPIPDAVGHLRDAVYRELLQQTQLSIVAIDITVGGMHLRSATPVSTSEVEA